jgi:hypothetical protein
VPDDATPRRGRDLDLLDAVLGPVPLVVFDRLLTVVVASELAGRVSPAFRVGHNLARFTFLDGDGHLHPALGDWPRKTRQVAAMLRESSGVDDDDAALVALVGELASLSREFATAWAADPAERISDVFEFVHPDVGALRLRYHLLRGPRRGADTIAIWHAADAASLLGLRALDVGGPPASDDPM